MNEALRDLYRYLAQKTSKDSIKRYLMGAGISQAQVDLEGKPYDIWFSIVNLAHDNGQILALIEEVQSDYEEASPVFTKFAELKSAYEQANSSAEVDTQPLTQHKGPEANISSIRTYVAETADLYEAVKQMLDLTRNVAALNRIENDIIALSGRINSLEQQNDGGGLPSHEYTRQQNVLRNAVLSTLERMERRLNL